MSDLARWLDVSTGALRRAAFDARLAEAVRASRRAGSPLSVLWIDLDDLLEHNDLHGQEAIDGAIGSMVQSVADHLDGAGPIGRVTGGAFGVVLPGVDRRRAVELSRSLRAHVMGGAHPIGEDEVRFTVSVGVASLRASEPWGNLLEAAEEACIRAKQSGRNAVVAR
jgi:diguanylate cyclase (GGDEF)-like protein